MEIDPKQVEHQWLNDSIVELEGKIKPSYTFSAVIFNGEIESIELYNKEGVLVDALDEVLNLIKQFYDDHIKETSR